MTKKYVVAGLAFLVLFGAVGGFLFWRSLPEKDPYEGLVTSIDVSISDETRADLETRVSEARAKIDAQDSNAPFEQKVYLDLASDLLKLGDLAGARETYEVVLQKINSDPAIWINYGRVLMQMQDYAKAEESFRTVMQLGGGMEASIRDLYDSVAKQNTDGSRTQELKRILEVGVEGAGQTPWLMITLGDWYRDAGDCVRAKDHYLVARSLVGLQSQKEMVDQSIEALKDACK